MHQSQQQKAFHHYAAKKDIIHKTRKYMMQKISETEFSFQNVNYFYI